MPMVGTGQEKGMWQWIAHSAVVAMLPLAQAELVWERAALIAQHSPAWRTSPHLPGIHTPPG